MAPRSRSTLNIEPAMLFHDSAVLLFFCCIWYNDHEHTGLEVLERRREQIDRKKQELREWELLLVNLFVLPK